MAKIIKQGMNLKYYFSIVAAIVIGVLVFCYWPKKNAAPERFEQGLKVVYGSEQKYTYHVKVTDGTKSKNDTIKLYHYYEQPLKKAK